MPTPQFFAKHYRVINADSESPVIHFRGTSFTDAMPQDDDPGWEDVEGGGRKIRVHGPFVVGELECNDGWIYVDAGGDISVMEG